MGVADFKKKLESMISYTKINSLVFDKYNKNAIFYFAFNMLPM